MIKPRHIESLPLGGTASPVTSAKRSYSRVVIGLLFASACGVAVYLTLTPASFQTDAVVEIVTKDPSVRVAMTQAAVESVLSKPVLLRAAAGLSDLPAPRPDAFESMAVTFGLAGAHATGRDARLARQLRDDVNVLPGEWPGSIDIAARGQNAATAARIADGIAAAFISDQDDRAADLRQRRGSALATRIDQFRIAASTAHARLAALGPDGADPTQLLALAANRRVAAQERVDAVRRIIASGSPPLSDRKDLPETITTLQSAYLDLSGQLLKAKETLGDRHMTIISLKEGVARASANLGGEWRQFERLTRAELDAARAQEANVRKNSQPVDAGRQTASDIARLAARQADERVTSAEAERDDAIDDNVSYRLLSHASVPLEAVGLTQQTRAMIATASPCALVAVMGLAFGFRRRSRRSAPRVPGVDRREAAADFGQDEEAGRRDAIEPFAQPRAVTPKSPRKPRFVANEAGVKKATESILSALEITDPRYGVSTLMIAANGSDTESRPVALDLAYAIAARGRRVLLIEGPRFEPELAAIADPEAEPILADLFGTLRVMFRSDAEHGVLYVAPSFKDAARIASVLARDADVPLLEEIASEFDILIYDGARAGSLDIETDLYLRVGRFKSARADAQFRAACGEPDAIFIGSMVGNAFQPTESADAALVDAPPASHDPIVLAPLSPRRAPVDRSRHVRFDRARTPRRSVVARTL